MPNDVNVPESVAWILYIDPDNAIAVGQYEIVYILKYENNKLHRINGPDYFNQSIMWQGKEIKIFDLDRFINLQNRETKNVLYEYIVIVPYIQDGHDVIFLGLKIINIPIKLKVKDTQQCDYPDNYAWGKLSSSCFYDEKYGTIPVLDVAKILSFLG